MVNDSIDIKLLCDESEQEAAQEFVDSWDFKTSLEHTMSNQNFPPIKLLVYDDYLTMLFITNNGRGSVGVRSHTDKNFFDWVDMSLTILYHSLKIVDLTSDPGSIIQKLGPRLDLDWLDYDPTEHVLGEIRTKECDARKYLQVAMPEQTLERSPQNDLYSVSTSYSGRTEVVHMRIDNNYRGMSEKGMIECISCEGQSTTYHDEPVKEMIGSLREQHSDALVLQEPLNFCTHKCPMKGYSCLPAIFEEVYALKTGSTEDEIKLAHEQGKIDRMFPE